MQRMLAKDDSAQALAVHYAHLVAYIQLALSRKTDERDVSTADVDRFGRAQGRQAKSL